MPKKSTRACIIVLTAVLLLSTMTASVFAQGAHLWFYSVDPSTLPDWTGTIDGSVNPQDDDPNYMGSNSDPWMTESVVIVSGDWNTPFSLWIGNADPQDDCYCTKLVISINDDAAAAITGITVDGTAVSWDTNAANFPLPPHGISNSAEFYGFGVVEIGTAHIASGGYVEVVIDITPSGGALDDAKIHFDALGWSNDACEGDYDMFSPFSHDSTFIVPEAATILAVSASMLALGLYAYKRKKE